MGEGYLTNSNVVIGYLDNNTPYDGMRMVHEIIDHVPNISVIFHQNLVVASMPNSIIELTILLK